MSRSQYTPPPQSLAREFVEAFFTLFVGVFLQVGRLFRLLALKTRRGLARSALRGKAVAMGRRMEQAGAGDQMLLQQLEATPEERKREPLLAQLGELGLEPGVPLMGLKEEYQAGHEAFRRCRQAERDHDEAAYKLVPHSALGWFALLASYALTGFAALLLAAYLLPGKLPSAIDRIVNKAPAPEVLPLPSARFDEVEVDVVSVRVARSDLAAGDARKVVTDEGLILFLKLRITNRGSVPLTYRSWRGRFKSGDDVFARVNDHRGESLRRIVHRDDAPPDGGVRSGVIEPGAHLDDMLEFAPPDSSFQRLDIFLPGESVGKPRQTKQLTLTAPQVERPEAWR